MFKFPTHDSVLFAYSPKDQGSEGVYYFRLYDQFLIELDETYTTSSGNLLTHNEYVDFSLFDSYDDFINKYSNEYDEVKKWLDSFESGVDVSTLMDLIHVCSSSLPSNIAKTALWIAEIKNSIKEGYYKEELDLTSHYIEQERKKTEVICINEIPDKINFIAGIDVAYNETEQKILAVVVIMNADTFEVIEKVHHLMNITFPYIPGIFSFREILPLRKAFKKLSIKPDLIICDGHGISHPNRIGVATHLGVELDIPTIGCAKKRLVGVFDETKLGKMRGSFQELIWNDEVVGRALRTQENEKPVFVSVGHKVDLEIAQEYVLKLCSKHRFPLTTIRSDEHVNSLLHADEDIEFMRNEECDSY